MKDGNVFEHRVVAYDAHDGVCPPCFWCAVPLTWPDAVADHLDEDKMNNAVDNLVVSCNPCNRARGAILPFLAGMREEVMPLFLKLAADYNKTHKPKDRMKDTKRVEGRNSKRMEVTLGDHWRTHTRPVEGLTFVGTVQRGMHIGALGKNQTGQWFAVNQGRWKLLTPRKIEAALSNIPVGPGGMNQLAQQGESDV